MMKKTGRPRKKITLTQLAAYLRISPATVSRALNGDTAIKAETRAHVNAAAAYKGYVKKKSFPQNEQQTHVNGQVTMRDIASKLGMSPATVCRAFKRAPTVSEKTIDRVLAAAEELGYARNYNASNLVAKKNAKEGSFKPTIYTIAKTLKVSPATVSRAFSATTSIAPATKKRVLREAARVNFTPNHDATALKTEHGAEPPAAMIPTEMAQISEDQVTDHKTFGKVIGFLVPQMAHSLLIDLMAGLEESAAQSGSQLVMITLTTDSLTSKTRKLKALVAITDGLIYLPFSMTNILPANLLVRRPYALLGTFQTDDNHLYARIDQFDAICRAASLLLQAGCKQIVLFDAILNEAAHTRRRAGFLKAHLEHNMLPFNEQIIRFPGRADMPQNIANHLHSINPTADGLILVDRLPDHSELQLLNHIGIRAENIVAIEMESGPRDFRSPAVFNRLCYSYYELGRQAFQLVMETMRGSSSIVSSSVELPGQLLSAAKPFDRVNNRILTKDDHYGFSDLRSAKPDVGFRNISDV
ncbi:LacI family DNA-binding transcriptional regulator [Mucilaginibacter sp. AW1-3]